MGLAPPASRGHPWAVVLGRRGNVTVPEPRFGAGLYLHLYGPEPTLCRKRLGCTPGSAPVHCEREGTAEEWERGPDSPTPPQNALTTETAGGRARTYTETCMQIHTNTRVSTCTLARRYTWTRGTHALVNTRIYAHTHTHRHADKTCTFADTCKQCAHTERASFFIELFSPGKTRGNRSSLPIPLPGDPTFAE